MATNNRCEPTGKIRHFPTPFLLDLVNLARVASENVLLLLCPGLAAWKMASRIISNRLIHQTGDIDGSYRWAACPWADGKSSVVGLEGPGWRAVEAPAGTACGRTRPPCRQRCWLLRHQRSFHQRSLDEHNLISRQSKNHCTKQIKIGHLQKAAAFPGAENRTGSSAPQSRPLCEAAPPIRSITHHWGRSSKRAPLAERAGEEAAKVSVAGITPHREPPLHFAVQPNARTPCPYARG